MSCDECHKTEGSGERWLEQFQVLLLSSLSIIKILRGREKHLFQAWLDVELATALLSLSRTFVVLLLACWQPWPVNSQCVLCAEGWNFISPLQIHCFDFESCEEGLNVGFK